MSYEGLGKIIGGMKRSVGVRKGQDGSGGAKRFGRGKKVWEG